MEFRIPEQTFTIEEGGHIKIRVELPSSGVNTDTTPSDPVADVPTPETPEVATETEVEPGEQVNG